MATDKRRYTLRLQDENFEKIKIIADKDKRSIAMQIEFLIEKAIKEHEDKYGPIQLEE